MAADEGSTTGRVPVTDVVGLSESTGGDSRVGFDSGAWLGDPTVEPPLGIAPRGEGARPNEAGPGAGSGELEASHWTGTPSNLQALGSEIAKVLLMGSWNGTLPVTIRHAQFMPLLASDLSELQHSDEGVAGADPLPPLL